MFLSFVNMLLQLVLWYSFHCPEALGFNFLLGNIYMFAKLLSLPRAFELW